MKTLSIWILGSLVSFAASGLAETAPKVVPTGTQPGTAAAVDPKGADCGESKDKTVQVLTSDAKTAEQKALEQKALENLGLKKNAPQAVANPIAATPPMETCK